MKADDVLVAVKTRLEVALKSLEEIILAEMLHDSAGHRALVTMLRGGLELILAHERSAEPPLPRRSPLHAIPSPSHDPLFDVCDWPDDHAAGCRCAQQRGQALF